MIVANHSKLDLQFGFLVVRNGEGLKKVILDEIDLLIIETPAVSITVALLAELSVRKVKVIFCNRERNPFAELMPYHGCHDSARKLREQLNWSDEAKGKVWGAIVQCKIARQAALLNECGKTVSGEQLQEWADAVVPGDDFDNREAIAARAYFTALFSCQFTRKLKIPVNAALDYGYMIMLAVFNRTVTAHGYLTQLGIFHHNTFNPYNFSCDLIEPFRPLVDRKVIELASDDEMVFGTNEKHALVELLHDDVTINGMKRTVIAAINDYVTSVADALTANDPTLIRFPEYGR